MPKILTFEIPEDEYNQLKEFLENASVEMKESREKMRKDQFEIDRLDEEIKQLKSETEALKSKSDKILNELVEKHLKAA